MSESVDWDTTLEALSNQDRRRLLMALFERDSEEDPMNVPEELHSGERTLENLQTQFVHVHLPKLDSTGLVDWDHEGNQVDEGPAFDEIRPLLKYIDENQEEFPEGWI